MKISYKSLQKLNPRYRTHKVPIYGKGPALVRVPTGKLAIAHRAARGSYTTIAKRVYRPLKITRYKVRRGDNLTKIAKKFGVTVSSLRKTNSLGRRSVLFVGKRLKVVRTGSVARSVSSSKSRNVSAKASKNYRKIKKVHKVAKGENLSLIAKRYKVSLSKLLRFNNFRLNKKLYVGQKIKLTPTNVARNRKSTKRNKVVTYKVKAGDNLQKISKRFGTSVNQLKASNGLRSSRINTGKKLQITAANIKMHIVKRGESLIAIANKYKVSMSNILYANNLKNKSKIQIGRRLTIPVASHN